MVRQEDKKGLNEAKKKAPRLGAGLGDTQGQRQSF
jgi:hypothetical protein